ncbi:MAG: hypothetical protein GX030_08735 [Firmicutes bacterium]|nr:hypothetical protein [Bacillota bacterium]
MNRIRFYTEKIKREAKKFQWYRFFDWIHMRGYGLLFAAVVLLFFTLLISPTAVLVLVTFLLVLLLLSMTK